MSEIPRKRGFYWPSSHAVIQHKHRDIDWDLVAETIENGKAKPTHKEDCTLFIKDFEMTNQPVGVVASHETGEILTVEWRY